MRTRVKICGLTRTEDAKVAVKHGVDAIGLVFYPDSSRVVTIEQAQGILTALPPFVTAVGLFVNPSAEQVRQCLAVLPLGLLQFHGSESPAFCTQFERPWIKAIRMRPEVDLLAEWDRYRGAAALLVDAYVPGMPGGTGETFSWERIPSTLRGEVILAGGLTPANVGSAIMGVRPYAVDVSGGVEQSPGIKDPGKIRAFIEGVQRGDDSNRF